MSELLTYLERTGNPGKLNGEFRSNNLFPCEIQTRHAMKFSHKLDLRKMLHQGIRSDQPAFSASKWAICRVSGNGTGKVRFNYREEFVVFESDEEIIEKFSNFTDWRHVVVRSAQCPPIPNAVKEIIKQADIPLKDLYICWQPQEDEWAKEVTVPIKPDPVLLYKSNGTYFVLARWIDKREGVAASLEIEPFLEANGKEYQK